MKKLTEDQMELLVKPRNQETGVNAITREMLDKIDIDEVPFVVRRFKNYTGDDSVLMSDGRAYHRDRFTPKSGSYAFKPSFAGRQILIGKQENGRLIFSNGIWFSTFVPDDLKHLLAELDK